MDLKGSKTEQNLMEAFAGESKARNKYTFYSKRAAKDGYEQISRIFEETSNNEKAHAKIWFKLLNGGDVSDTISNLEDAVISEHYEWTEMYVNFAKEAKETDRLWWKTPRLFMGSESGIAVRTQWQSGSAIGDGAPRN